MAGTHPESEIRSLEIHPEERLESWKEIAAYLKRDVSTVQRWEKREQLPVHRHVHDKLSTVYAYRSELDAWWDERKDVPDATRPRYAAIFHKLRPQLFVALTGVFLAVLLGFTLWWLWHQGTSSPKEAIHVTISLPTTTSLGAGGKHPFSISPDGSRLAYAASTAKGSLLFLRSLNRPTPKPLLGTKGAFAPFFSPDGSHIGFFADGKLKKLSLAAGLPAQLCKAPFGRGGCWGPDDTIYFAPIQESGIWKISASGGDPEEITTLDVSKGEFTHRWPEVLPNGKAVLFTIVSAGKLDDIAVVSLQTGKRKILINGANSAHYTTTGHVVFAQDPTGDILAAPFDTDRLEITGASIPVLDGVDYRESYDYSAFTFSHNGTLAYLPAKGRSLVWVSRNGISQPMSERQRLYIMPRISPDGQRLATSIEGDIWVYEIERDTLTRLTFSPSTDFQPVWGADGQRITFASFRAGQMSIFWSPADGSGDVAPLLESEYIDRPFSFSPDGKLLFFQRIHPSTGVDIWVLPLEADHEPWPLIATPFREGAPSLSPNGHWLVYHSTATGRLEVYVQAFPEPKVRLQISSDGGGGPQWGPNGREILYRSGTKLMAVDIETEPTLTVGKPRVLFDAPNTRGGFCISPDGQRLVMIEQQPQTELKVVLNWYEELRRLVPVN